MVGIEHARNQCDGDVDKQTNHDDRQRPVVLEMIQKSRIHREAQVAQWMKPTGPTAKSDSDLEFDESVRGKSGFVHVRGW